MGRQTWIEGQSITSSDLNHIALGVEQSLLEQVLKNLLEGREGFVGDDFKVMRASATTFTVNAGLGIYSDSSQTAPETKFRPLHNADGATIYTITNPHATLPRIDTVQIRALLATDATASRDVKDGVGAVAPATVTIREKWSYELQIKDGTAAGSPTAPAADAGWVKIAEIYVTATPTGILDQAAITDSRVVMALLDALDARLDTAETDIDALQAADTALDGRLDTLEGQNLNTRTTALETYTAENAAQTTDLWEWDLPLTNISSVPHVTSVNANSNDLDIKRTGSAGAATYAGAFIETTYASMLLELIDMFSRGLSIKIVDSSANSFVIVPKAAGLSTFYTHVAVSGGMVSGAGDGTCTLKLKASGIGVLFDVYKNGSSVATFSTFVTTTSFTTASFRVVVYGTSKLLRLTNGLADVGLIKKRYIRAFWPMNSNYPYLTASQPSYKMTFRTHRMHRLLFEVMPYGFTTNTTCYVLYIFNHLTTIDANSHQIAQINFDMNYADVSPCVFEFFPTGSDMTMNGNQSEDFNTGRTTYGSITDMSAFFERNKTNIDKIVVEEV